MKRFAAALIVALVAAPAIAATEGDVLNVPAYCVKLEDAKKFLDVVTAGDRDAFRAFLSDASNTCIYLPAVAQPPAKCKFVKFVGEHKGYKLALVDCDGKQVHSFTQE
jgi:hypothetical protein